MPDANWYVIHTYSGYENKVAANIKKMVENRGMEEIIQDINIPVEKVIEVKTDGNKTKKKEVERKIYPGYVMVKMVMTDESWYIVRNTRGVTGFVGTTTKPIPLTNAEVEKLGVETKEIVINYAVGDNVKVTEGPLAGFVGIVEDIDPTKQKVKIRVSMFGKETLAEMEVGEAQPV